MIHLLHYNWMVREETFDICNQISNEELLRKRMGGVGSILYTLFHIIDVEYSWVRGIQGKPDIPFQIENYSSIHQIQELSRACRDEIQPWLQVWSSKMGEEVVSIAWTDGSYMKGEILRHIIAHEIHHMGQLSIWIRELGLQPASANVIGRGLFKG